MAWGNDFHANSLSYDSAFCMASMKLIILAHFNAIEDKLIDIFRDEIERQSKASHEMKTDAKTAVREVSKNITATMIETEIGFDEAYARSLALDFYVRTMVVIYGNQAGGVLYTKPGQYTWKKHVKGYGLSTAKTRYRLKGFDQRGRPAGIRNNAISQIAKYFRDMLNDIEKALDDKFFEHFVVVR